MKKPSPGIVFTVFLLIAPSAFSATLTSLNKTQLQKNFFHKTFISVSTDNLNGRTINNTFSMYLDGKGNIVGRMSVKPANQPQNDRGVYSISETGSLYIQWQHWDAQKRLCAKMYNTQNAYLAISCKQVFHTVFMKAAIKSGNHLG